MAAEGSECIGLLRFTYIKDLQLKSESRPWSVGTRFSIGASPAVAVEDQVKVTHLMAAVFFHILGHSLQNILAVIVDIYHLTAGPAGQMDMGCRISILAAYTFSGIKTAHKTQFFKGLQGLVNCVQTQTGELRVELFIHPLGTGMGLGLSQDHIDSNPLRSCPKACFT